VTQEISSHELEWFFEHVPMARSWKPKRFRDIRLGGTALEIRSALGLQSGWPTAGLGISFFRVLQIDVATWAEEAGRYVGQNDMRHWTARVRFGGW